VVAAFNEFCSPNIEEALEDVCRKGYDTIIIVLHDAHSRGFSLRGGNPLKNKEDIN
jgi:hypothetical protein